MLLTNSARQAAWRQRNRMNDITIDRSLFTNGTFVAWDGEGKTRKDDTHLYTLLMNNENKYIQSSKGLSTAECFDFLFTGSDTPLPIHVMFGASYDVNMMLGDLGEDDLRRIAGQEWNDHTDEWDRANTDDAPTLCAIEGRNYNVRYRHRKLLNLTRYDDGGKKNVRLYDVQGFFQSSFVDALADWNVGTPEEITLVDKMKKKRSTFARETQEDIRFYCLLECRLLAELMNKLRAMMVVAGIKVSSWDGTGAIARSVMGAAGVKQYLSRVEEPPGFIYAKRVAYSGGRIEVMKVGEESGEFYDYDINSAYPSVLVDLPCLVHGTRTHKKGLEASKEVMHGGRAALKLVKVAFRFMPGYHWYPLFVRDNDGSIKYPHEGEGWYWLPEVEAAQKFCGALGGRMSVQECYVWHQECDHKPFSFIHKLYEDRQVFKWEKNPAEKVLKLAINSCYGKTCQQVGGSIEKYPPYFSLEWAGMTTSSTRARLVELALQKPEHVIFFATDGILSSSSLDSKAEKVTVTRDNVAITFPALGSWGLSLKANRVIVAQAGYYYLFEDDGVWVSRSRGIEKQFTQGQGGEILKAWRVGHEIVGHQLSRFVTLRSALSGNSLSPSWRHWTSRTQGVYINGRSSKRLGVDETKLLLDGLHSLTVRPSESFISQPYDVFFYANNEDNAIMAEEEEDNF